MSAKLNCCMFESSTFLEKMMRGGCATYDEWCDCGACTNTHTHTHHFNERVSTEGKHRLQIFTNDQWMIHQSQVINLTLAHVESWTT